MSADKLYDEKTNPFWLTKCNYHKSLFDMTDQYLLASLEKCIRNQWRLSMIPHILDELVSRGYRELIQSYSYELCIRFTYYVLTNQGPAKTIGWKNDTWILTNLEATHYLAIDQPFLSKFYDSFAEFKHDFPEYFI